MNSVVGHKSSEFTLVVFRWLSIFSRAQFNVPPEREKEQIIPAKHYYYRIWNINTEKMVMHLVGQVAVSF